MSRDAAARNKKDKGEKEINGVVGVRTVMAENDLLSKLLSVFFSIACYLLKMKSQSELICLKSPIYVLLISTEYPMPNHCLISQYLQ